VLRRTVLAISSAGLVLAMSAATVFAANPAGTGQPGAECGDEGAEISPAGFDNNSGFAIAEDHYAGSDGTASLMHAASGAAVSQYDVACYQITQHH
jgi:hypothetical protein